MYLVSSGFSFKPTSSSSSSSSTQFSQEWARRKVVVKHSIKSNKGQYNDKYILLWPTRQEPGSVHTFGAGSSLGANMLHKHGTNLLLTFSIGFICDTFIHQCLLRNLRFATFATFANLRFANLRYLCFALLNEQSQYGWPWGNHAEYVQYYWNSLDFTWFPLRQTHTNCMPHANVVTGILWCSCRYVSAYITNIFILKDLWGLKTYCIFLALLV